jgi:pimeloyl-ACP methyl ester carboxylesterase
MTTTVGPALLVLHDIADEAAGTPWRAAFERCGWPGAVVAPDLPGHGAEAAPVGGAYELADAAFLGADLIAGSGLTSPVVVGVGVNGWAAQLLALGGLAGGVVLVDGLNGPWIDAVAATESSTRWHRSLVADPDAVAPPPVGVLDPRLRHGVRPHGDRDLAIRAAAALTVPVLVVESARSALTAAQRDEVVARMPLATVAELATPTPASVAETVMAWRTGSLAR